MTTRHRRVLTHAAALGVACAIAVSGCSSSMPSASEARDYSYSMGSADSSAEPMDSGTKTSGTAGSASPTDASRIDVDEQIIVTGSLRMVVESPGDAASQITDIVRAHGGQIASQSLSTRSNLPYANMTARIPAASFDQALSQIHELGDVKSMTTTNEDVGAQVADLDARIAALESSIARLTELMKDAATTGEVLEAERELTNRQADLDSLNSQRAWYADRVALSTLDIELSSPSVEAAPSRSVWVRSWESFLEGMNIIAYVLIMLAPWLIVIVPLVALLIWWWRRRRARRALQATNTDNGAGRWWRRKAPTATTVSNGALAPAETTAVGVDTTSIEGESAPISEEADHE